MHQQLNRKAAGTILERFKRLFPEDAFPIPGQVAKFSVDRLRTAGLSRPKASYIIDLAKRCNAGLIPSVRDCDLRPVEPARSKSVALRMMFRPVVIGDDIIHRIRVRGVVGRGWFQVSCLKHSPHSG